VCGQLIGLTRFICIYISNECMIQHACMNACMYVCIYIWIRTCRKAAIDNFCQHTGVFSVVAQSWAMRMLPHSRASWNCMYICVCVCVCMCVWVCVWVVRVWCVGVGGRMYMMILG